MKMTIMARPIGPCIESEVLLKFIIKKCHEIIEQNRESLPRIWVSLTLAAVAHDEEFYDQIKQIISSSASAQQILRLCKNIFLPSLDRLDGVATPEWVDAEEKYPPAEEQDYNRLLRYALIEGKKMLADKDYEFVRVFEVVAWIGLQYYDYRLCQFQDARESFQDDPESLVRKGVEIIKTVAYTSRNKN